MLREELKKQQMVMRGGRRHNNKIAGKDQLSLLEQGICPIYQNFVVINLFLSNDLIVL